MTTRDFLPFRRHFNWPGLPVDRPFCIAHRGASDHARENTLNAFRLASEMGAEMWELDVQMTRDGVPVVSHDNHLLRVFGVDVLISDLTADELKARAVIEVPTFSEVAALARDLGAGLYVELKARGSGPKCWHELILHDQHFAAFGSFDPAQIRQLRDMGCDWPLSILVGVGYDPLMLADLTGADIVHLCWERDGERPQDRVTPDLIGKIFASGREIVLWHEERLPVLSEIMQFPVLGICTNQPDLMTSDRLKMALHD